MRVLVTGAEGYIGTILSSVLLEDGHDVVGLDTGFYSEGWLYDSPLRQPIPIHRDTRRLTAEDLRGFDAIVHLAELSNDPLGELDPRVTPLINHQGSTGLARQAKTAGVPLFVYSSSCSVYGLGTEELKTEESAVAPLTLYGKCKVLVERDLLAMADEDFSPVILRNATAYGPSPRMRFDLVLNNLAGFAWTTGEIAMLSDGTPHRPMVHVRDIARAVVCTLDAPRDAVHGQVFNVGETTENYRIRELAEIAAAAFPGCRVTLGPAGGDHRSYRVSFDKIHERLPRFSCRQTVAAGAQELRDLFARIGLSQETFEFRGYTRVRQLRHLITTGQIDEEFFWRSPAPALGR